MVSNGAVSLYGSCQWTFGESRGGAALSHAWFIGCKVFAITKRGEAFYVDTDVLESDQSERNTLLFRRLRAIT